MTLFNRNSSIGEGSYQYSVVYTYEGGRIRYMVPTNHFINRYKIIVEEDLNAFYYYSSNPLDVFTTDGIDYYDESGALSDYSGISVKVGSSSISAGTLFINIRREESEFIIDGNKFTMHNVELYDKTEPSDSWTLLHGDKATTNRDVKKMQDKFDVIFREIYGKME